MTWDLPRRPADWEDVRIPLVDDEFPVCRHCTEVIIDPCDHAPDCPVRKHATQPDS